MSAEKAENKIKNYYIEFLLLILLGVFCILTVCYMDITVAPRFGVTFIDSLLDGEPLSFYYLSNMAGINAEGANYDMGYFILYGIWDLPIWFLHHLTGLDTGSAGCLIWYKLPLLICVLITARETVHVAKLCGIATDPEKKDQQDLYAPQEVVLLFLTTSVLFFPVMIACQCDIISVCFAMGATRLFMEDRHKAALLMFAVSMTVKPFTIFWLAVCVTYKNRSLLKIILEFVCGCSLFLISRGLYILSPSHPNARQAALTENPEALMEGSLHLGNGEASLFFTAVVLVLILAYADRKDHGTQKGRRKLLMYLFALWGAFILFAGIVPYWAVYFAPVSMLVMCMVHTDAALLMDLAVNVALTVNFILTMNWVYGGSRTFSYLLLKPLFTDERMASDGTTVAGLLTTLHLHHYMPVFYAIVLGGILFIGGCGILAASDKGKEYLHSGEDCSRSVRGQILLRILFLYGFIAAALAAMAATMIWKYPA